MTIFLPGPLPDHARTIMQRLGYGEQRTRQGQISYNRRFTPAPFPKFHAYVEERNSGLQVNLHLDQKAASYDSGHAHGGEYDGPLVEREMARIKAFVEGLRAQGGAAGNADSGYAAAEQEDEPKRGFWGSLFGG